LSGLLVRDGRAEIVFDAGALPRSGPDPAIRFRTPGGAAERIAATSLALGRLEREAFDASRATRKSRGDPLPFVADATAKQLHEIAARLGSEKDALVRGYLLLRQLELSEPDSMLARAALDAVEPTSPLWSLLWSGPERAWAGIVRTVSDRSRLARYEDRVWHDHSDPLVRAAFLFQAILAADAKGDAALVDRLYAEFASKYADTPRAAVAKSRFDPARAIRKGKPVPDFHFTSMDDSTRAYTPASFPDQVWLADFWAVWCGPCVAEMKTLHEVWERYRDRGFTIVSLSFDDAPETVRKFRAGKWPMPWHHVFLGRAAMRDERVRRFEVTSIPAPILVDGAGRILAYGNELRGAQLGKTLEKFLSGTHPGSP
jgi:thiol-disulfide isomerase/thioredoxin